MKMLYVLIDREFDEASLRPSWVKGVTDVRTTRSTTGARYAVPAAAVRRLDPRTLGREC